MSELILFSIGGLIGGVAVFSILYIMFVSAAMNSRR